MRILVSIAILLAAYSSASARCVEPSADDAGQLAYLSCVLSEKQGELEVLEKTVALQGQAIISNGNRISDLSDQNQSLLLQIDRLVDRIEALEAKN